MKYESVDFENNMLKEGVLNIFNMASLSEQVQKNLASRITL